MKCSSATWRTDWSAAMRLDPSPTPMRPEIAVETIP